MKHIHQRDMIKLWEEFLQRFKLEIVVDKDKGYIYIKSFLWYTDAKLSEERQVELEQVLAKYLSEEEKGNIMRTIAQKYIEEGETRGIQIGKAEEKISVAKNLKKAGISTEIISQSTGLSNEQIESLNS